MLDERDLILAIGDQFRKTSRVCPCLFHGNCHVNPGRGLSPLKRFEWSICICMQEQTVELRLPENLFHSMIYRMQ